MNFGPSRIETTSATTPAIRTRTTSAASGDGGRPVPGGALGLHRRQSLCDRLEADCPRSLDEDAVPRFDDVLDRRQGRSSVRRPAVVPTPLGELLRGRLVYALFPFASEFPVELAGGGAHRTIEELARAEGGSPVRLVVEARLRPVLLLHDGTRSEQGDVACLRVNTVKPALKTRRHLAMVFNVDGFGGRAAKLGKYRDFARHRHFPLGFKLFYDWDISMMSPRDVLRMIPPECPPGGGHSVSPAAGQETIRRAGGVSPRILVSLQ